MRYAIARLARIVESPQLGNIRVMVYLSPADRHSPRQTQSPVVLECTPNGVRTGAVVHAGTVPNLQREHRTSKGIAERVQDP